MNKQGFVYILAGSRNGTLYTGVTSNLQKRIVEHKRDAVHGFTQIHNVKTLVYLEQHENILSALIREKQIKKWNRAWKLRLIEEYNPQWKDIDLGY